MIITLEVSAECMKKDKIRLVQQLCIDNTVYYTVTQLVSELLSWGAPPRFPEMLPEPTSESIASIQVRIHHIACAVSSCQPCNCVALLLQSSH